MDKTKYRFGLYILKKSNLKDHEKVCMPKYVKVVLPSNFH